MKGLIKGAHHASFPCSRRHWPELKRYFMLMGLDVREVMITDNAYDYIGTGPRMQIGVNGNMMLSIFEGGMTTRVIRLLHVLRRGRYRPHVALKVGPQAIALLKDHPRCMGWTHWGHSKLSIFHHVPGGFVIEYVTEDPDYHNDQSD